MSHMPDLSEKENPGDAASSVQKRSAIVPGTGGKVKESRIVAWFAGLLLIALILCTGVYAYLIYAKKASFSNLGRVIDKQRKVASISANWESFEGGFTGNLIYHEKADQLSRLDIFLNDINGQKDQDLKIHFVSDSQDAFLRMWYSQIDLLLLGLLTGFPQATSLQTYSLLLPVVKGESWLHAKWPEISPSRNTDKAASNDDFTTVGEKFMKSVILRKNDRNYKKNGISYRRMTLGFDKEKLIDAISSIKETKAEIKVSDINSLIDVVSAVDNWDRDLIEIFLSRKSGFIEELGLSLPQIPEGAIKKSLEKNTDRSSRLAFLKSYSKQIEKWTGRNNDKLTPLATIEFSQFNTAPVVSRPDRLTEFETVAAAVTREILPLLSQMNAPMEKKAPVAPGLLKQRSFESGLDINSWSGPDFFGEWNSVGGAQ